MSDQINNAPIRDPAALRSAEIGPTANASGKGIAAADYPWFSSAPAAPGSITLPDNVTPITRDQIDDAVERILSHIIAR